MTESGPHLESRTGIHRYRIGRFSEDRDGEWISAVWRRHEDVDAGVSVGFAWSRERAQ